MPLPVLPKAPEKGPPLHQAVSDAGWGPYLQARGGQKLVDTARSTAALLDGLSFPLSLAWVLAGERAVRLKAGPKESVLHVIVLGATARAEVRVWQDTAYFQELDRALAGGLRVRLEFVGPVLYLYILLYL